MKYGIFVELARVKNVGVIRNTGYIPRKSSRDYQWLFQWRGGGRRGRRHAAATELYVWHLFKQPNQHLPITRTAHQDQTLEIFRSVHSVEVSLYFIKIKQDQSNNPLRNSF